MVDDSEGAHESDVARLLRQDWASSNKNTNHTTASPNKVRLEGVYASHDEFDEDSPLRREREGETADPPSSSSASTPTRGLFRGSLGPCLPCASNVDWSARRANCLTFARACLCPCLLLGNITSRLTREEPFACCRLPCVRPCVADCALGREGCGTCLSAACLSLCLWPCSLCLAAHALREREKLKLFYADDYRLQSASGCSACCFYLCCWPQNVLEQHAFVKTLHSEGQLTFKWDYDLYRDQMQPRPPTKTFVLLVFSTHTDGKMEFIRKLMMSVDRQSGFRHPATPPAEPSLSKRSESPELLIESEPELAPVPLHHHSEDSDLLLSYRKIDLSPRPSPKPLAFQPSFPAAPRRKPRKKGLLEADHQIHTWVRNLSVVQSEFVSFLEVWDIPTPQFSTFLVKHHTMDADIALYVLDPAMSDEDIAQVQGKYEENIRLFAGQHERKLQRLLEDTDDENDDSSKFNDLSKKTVSFLIVLTSKNPLFRPEELSAAEYAVKVNGMIAWAKKQGSLWEEIVVEEENDYFRFRKEIAKLLKGQ